MIKYLCFPDEFTARKTTGWWSKKSGWIAPTPQLQIAVRGVLYSDDGEYDADGNVTTQPKALPGFHVDVIYGVIPEAAQKFIINPSTPEYILA